MNTYLEDEEQLDKVYLYLKELYANAVATSDDDLGKLKFIDLVAFILDVLLPEVSYYILLVNVHRMCSNSCFLEILEKQMSVFLW